ncbi:nitroreductase family protein [soil metagenome]
MSRTVPRRESTYDDRIGYDYEHPYPSPDVLARYPFVPLQFERLPDDEMLRRGEEFYRSIATRRSVRSLSNAPVPRNLIELAVAAACTAPSGAHQQPWKFVATNDPALKRQIREAAEAEERVNYEGGRMNDEWQSSLARLGTDAHKEYLEAAPWLVVLFEERYGTAPDGSRLHHYYVKESVGIAAGIFITAIHTMGLVTLTHTPTPMAFLSKLLGRPASERPFVLFPVGYPNHGALVPDLARKTLDDVLVILSPEADR